MSLWISLTSLYNNMHIYRWHHRWLIRRRQSNQKKERTGGTFWSEDHARSRSYTGYKGRDGSREDIDFLENICKENTGDVWYNILQAQVDPTTSWNISVQMIYWLIRRKTQR